MRKMRPNRSRRCGREGAGALKPTEMQIQRALDKVGVTREQFKSAIGFDIGRLTGAELHAYFLNGSRGLRGFRSRFIEGGSGSGDARVERNSGQRGRSGARQLDWFGQGFSLAGARARIPQFKRDALETARAMALAGKTSEEIRAVTGWFPGKYDGKMRWEIPDEGGKAQACYWIACST
jgi:hypothetical protein